MAVLAAFMMVAVAGIVIVQSSDESEAAAGEAGFMNVYVNSAGTWAGQTVLAANGCEALKATSFYSASTATIDDRYTYTYVWDGQTYTDINAAYGTVTKLQDVANSGSNTWNVFVYIKDANGNWSWETGTNASGYYKPFADYANLLANYGTANIAFWFGNIGDSSAVQTAKAALLASSPEERGLTQIAKGPGSVYEHLFFLKNKAGSTMTFTTSVTTYNPVTFQYTSNVTLTNAVLSAGVYVVGYGSDAELALIDALGTDASFYASTDPVPGYQKYGWIDKIFNVGTETVVEGSGPDATTHYYFWSLYTTYDESIPYMAWAGYNIGAYSALINAPLVDGTLALIYEYS